jgi:hypothetical protein
LAVAPPNMYSLIGLPFFNESKKTDLKTSLDKDWDSIHKNELKSQ